MLMGKLPWRSDVLKKKTLKLTEVEKLIKDGWVECPYQLWKSQPKIYCKIIDNKPREILDYASLNDNYCYVEFKFISDGKSLLYAYGNFLKYNNFFSMYKKQLIFTEHSV